ncbi:ADP-heptose:LPS heptosyltransferase/lauroyl/myristoyl acyltransferase [Puniceicoccus vermicola]|uniref:Glycosyltransferase family 9 protein n=2 Tax=Puniceicoccus vermicola TaxID=388746 RepID=A0A7X1E456_9BACT|nr:hypothetical protein [Puniceicoccus vermicola]
MFLLVRVLSFLVRILPDFILQGICLGLGMFLYLLKSKRRIVMSNLAHIYPDLSEKELRRLARKNCILTIEMGLFALASPGFDSTSIHKRLKFGEDFEENYHRVAGTSPMLILLPHNYLNEMVIFTPNMLGLEKKKAAAIFRPMDDPKLDDWIRQTRERGGLKLLSRRGGLEAAIGHLRACGHLAILADQSAGDSGILGRVGGRTASLSPFPDLLVRKFPVQLAFVYIERTGFFRGTLHMGTPKDRDREPSVLFAEWMTEKLQNSEGWETNWLWMHRRWKTQRKPEKRLRLEQKRGISSDFYPIPDDRSRADRFYLRLPNWLGDIVMLTPLIRAIRKARPDVRLTLVYRPQFESLIDLLQIPCDDRLPADSRNAEGRKLLKDRRHDYPDTAILFTNSFRGDKEMWTTRAEQRFGINRPGKPRPLLTHSWEMPADLDEQSIHQTELWNRFLQHFGLLEEPDTQPLNGDPVSPDSFRIGLFSGSENSPEKRWAPEKWISLVEKLLAEYPSADIELYGTQGDREITEKILSAANNPRLTDYAGKTNLAELGERVRNCRFAIGNDSGGMHLANALGCPGVVLFGPTNPVRTRPVFDDPLEIVQAPDASPTGGGTMEAIEVGEVLAATRKLVDVPGN